MALIQKSYRYSISRNGVYLGDLPSVTSDFAFQQDINAAGSQLVITVAKSADTSAIPNQQYTDESGLPYTDESGNYMFTEGANPVVGSSVQSTLINNDNDILVYEISARYPNGTLIFSGYISSWQANFGGNDDDQITITCLSKGAELGNYLIESGQSTDQSQLLQNSFDVIYYDNKSGGYNYDYQTFTTGAAVTRVSAITLKLQGNGSPQTIYVFLTNSSLGFLPPGVAASQIITSTAIQDYTFTFPIPFTVTPNTVYGFSVQTSFAQTFVNIFYQNSNIYAGGLMYNANFSGVSGGVILPTPTGTITNASDLYFKTWSTTGATAVTYNNEDPTDILSNIITNYNSSGGSIVINNSTVETGLSVSYTFNVNSVLEGVEALLALAPSTYYWFVDIATSILYFKPAAKTPTYVLTKGKHITSLQLKTTVENVKNIVYFTGGDDGTGNNVYVKYVNTTSLTANNNKVGMDRISDTNVTVAATGLLLAQDDSNQHAYEEYQTKVTILDQTMDITLPNPGDMIGFSGFGNFVDSLLLQIVRIEYTPEQLTLTLGTVAPKVHRDIQKIKDALLALQVVNNPSVPT